MSHSISSNNFSLSEPGEVPGLTCSSVCLCLSAYVYKLSSHVKLTNTEIQHGLITVKDDWMEGIFPISLESHGHMKLPCS